MSMTPRDKKRYDLILEELRKWQNKKILLTTKAKVIADLVERVENLEKLMFFSLLNDAGEQGLTPELKQMMKETGYWELYEKFQEIMKIR